jgi:DoxX-like family
VARLRRIVKQRQGGSTRLEKNASRRSRRASFDVNLKGALGRATTSARRADEVMQTMVQAVPVAERAKVGTKVWIGRGLSGLVVLFMVFDAFGKIAAEEHVMKAMAELGWPPGQTVGLGILVLACTAIYVVPRTSILGAILLTGFLGGATAAKVRIQDASLFFSVLVGIVAWAGVYLRNDRLRALVPVEREARTGGGSS